MALEERSKNCSAAGVGTSPLSFLRDLRRFVFWMTKLQSEQLDELFGVMRQMKRSEKDVFGRINVPSMYGRASRLTYENWENVSGLLYLVRHLQKTNVILGLIDGSDDSLQFNDPVWDAFKNSGGFNRIYKEDRKKKRPAFLKAQFWVEQILRKVIPWMILTAIGYIIGVKSVQDKHQDRQSQQTRQSVSPRK